ncbi:glycosyl transferase [Alicyclobacillus hesperidum subsp. aegles]|uniref:glycosyltransferase family 4 protein n=1 Tax=Alicyclobacillus hesperidum TaxID=89784 RepID=UPI0022288B55|nr:glycosyltransferase family 4 protein [Alicyclobacillus hesperidum]GLG01489.1 glycosyl transferase [Alicyclobacillus hesperidum subsp. aegles]
MRTVIVFFAGNEVGGAASHLRTWAEGLAEARTQYQYRFVSLGDGPLASAVERTGGSLTKITGGFRSVIDALARIIRQERAWLLHSHGPRMNILAAYAAKRQQIPWTATIHSNPLYDFLGHPLKSFLFPKLHLWHLRQASGLFVVQPTLGDILPCKTILEVPNAIFLAPPARSRHEYRAFWHKQLRLPTSTRFMGVAARLDPVKNIDVLIQSVAKIPDPDVHLCIAGDGRERATLEVLADRLGVRDRVHFLGFLASVEEFYGALDVHVLPSKSEGAPTSVLEAGFYGAANVGSDIPALRRMLLNGEAGEMVPVGDVQALASAIHRLFHDDVLRNHYVQVFREQVLPLYSRDRMIAAYERGYTVLEEDAVRTGKIVPLENRTEWLRE